MPNMIKELRKIKGLNQTEFGKKLGVSRDVINNVENDRVELKENMVITICAIFHVRREWLLTGEGPMSPDTTSLLIDEVAKEYDLTQDQKRLLSIFFSMDKEDREMVAHAFFSMARKAQDERGRSGESSPSEEDPSTDGSIFPRGA